MGNIITGSFDAASRMPSVAQSANVMNSLPREIVNAVTGDQLKMIHAAADGYDAVKIQFTLPPHALGAPLHYHLNFVETFAVLDGQLEMSVGSAKNRQTVVPGTLIELPPGTLHSFRNPHSTPVTFVSEAKPTVEFEKFIRSMYGLANDGKTNQAGMPTNFLHLVLTLDFADLYFPVIPAWLQRTVRKTLVGFARSFGVEQTLSKYYHTLETT